MTDLDDRLESAFGRVTTPGIAEPEPVAQLQRRAHRHRARRALATATACAVVFGAVAGVLVAARHHGSSNDVQLLAPNVLLGDIDAVVLSSRFDESGARKPIPASVRDQLTLVPGVEEASGIVQRFTPEVSNEVPPSASDGPPRTPILFSYHEAAAMRLRQGARPAD